MSNVYSSVRNMSHQLAADLHNEYNYLVYCVLLHIGDKTRR